jgi:hypothetical protein
MNRVALAVALVAVAAGTWFVSDEAARAAIANAVGGKPAQIAAKAKAICASPVNPNVAVPTDCIPQYIANLPPDPGEAGKATIDGIDADKDGVRDDVQRWIAIQWGHSPLAVKNLTISAKQGLRAVHYGDSLGKEKTRERFAAESMRESACASDLETQDMLGSRRQVTLLVRNTPERKARADDFDMMFAHGVYPAFEGTADEACGFDVQALAAAESKQTLNSIYRAESIARTKQERLAELERLKKEDPERAREFAWENEFRYGIKEGTSR